MAKQSQQYLVVGMILIFIMMAVFIGVFINVLTYSPSSSLNRNGVALYVALCLAGAFFGILGGYLVGVHIGKQRSN
jgi:VIT1/CCC1 family predicted Fe2+/Mn2+ transporter